MGALNGFEILLVEDSPQYRIVARRILEGDGALVHEAEGVDQGLELAEMKIPHLIITDIEMPEKTGFDMIQAVKSTPKLSKIPIIVLSGVSDRKSIFQAISMGAKDYMIKPFSPPTFLQKVKKALELKAFRKHQFPRGEEPKVQFSTQGKIFNVSGVGFSIESNLLICHNEEVKLDSEFTNRLGEVIPMTRTVGPSRSMGGVRMVNDVAMIGADQDLARLIHQVFGKNHGK